MKKRLLVLLALAVTFVAAVGFAACTPKDSHTHDWSAEWTGNETEHWHNCNGCDQHTGTAAHVYDDENDATCNVCGMERHIHTYKWEHDNEYHWQVKDCHPDEEVKNRALHDFSQGLQCPVCGFDSTGIHQHTYEWRYNESTHWEESVCAEEHEPVTRENGDHEFDPATGLCKCGVSETETQVYALYKANETYKGAQASSFSDWQKGYKEQGVHHVGFTANGDGAFYREKQDQPGQYDEQAMYFTERTVNVSTVYHNAQTEILIQNACFVIKCKINGEFAQVNSSAVLAYAKTDAQGEATLTFTPVWGYSSGTVEYAVALAAANEVTDGTLTPLPTGYKILQSDEYKTLNVNGSTVELTADFVAYRTLGEGSRGELDNVYVENYDNTTDFYLDNLTAGVYKVELKTTTKGYMSENSTYISVDGGTQEIGVTVIKNGDLDKGGGEGWFYIYISENSQLLHIRRRIGSIIGSIKLIRITGSQLVIDQAEKSYDLAGNSQEAMVRDVKYDISDLENGLYVFTYDHTNVSPYFYIHTASGKTSISENKVFEVKDETTAFSVNCSIRGNAVKGFVLHKVERITADNEFSVPFDATHKTFRYAFTSGEKGSYSIALSADSAFTDVSVSCDLNPWILYRQSGTSAKGYFNAQAETDYVFTISAPGDDNGTVKATIHFEKAQEVSVGDEITVEFDSGNTQKEYDISVTKGAYMLELKGTNLKDVDVQRDGTNLVSGVLDGVTRYIAVFVETTSYKDSTFTFKYSGSADYPTVTAVIKPIELGGAQKVSANTDFKVTVSEEEECALAEFTPSENSKYYRLLLNSQADIQNLRVYTFILRGENFESASQLVSAGSDAQTEKSADYSSSVSDAAKLYLAFVYNKTAANAYPSEITANFHLRFKIDTATYTPKKSGDFGVTFQKVEGADSYELYMSSSRATGFNKVADFGKDDEILYTYTDLKYASARYFYFIAKDSTGKYLDGKSSTNTEAISFLGRLKYNVTVTVPEGFDNDVTIYFKSTMSGSSSTYHSEMHHIKAEPGKLSETFEIIFAPDSGASQTKVSVTVGGANSNIYKVPTAVTSGSGDVNFTIEKNPIVTVTIDLSEIDEFAGGSVTVTLYKGDTTSTLTSGSVSVASGEKSATIVMPITSTSVDFTNIYAKITTLPTGYGAKETNRVKVDFNEGTKSGTVTLGIEKLPSVTVTLTFPQGVTSGSYKVNFYKKTDDSVASSSTTNVSITATAEGTASGVAYMGKGTYVARVTAPSDSGYSADEQEITVDGDENLAITIKDRITITVTISADKKPSSTVYFKIYEKGTENTVGSTQNVSSSRFTENGGKYEATKEVYAPEGKSYEIKGDDRQTDKTISFVGAADVSVDGKTGTATLEITVKIVYKISVTVAKGSYPQNIMGTDNFALYKNNEEYKLASLSLMSSQATVTFEIPEEEFDPKAQYAVRYKGTLSNGFYCPGGIVNFGSSTTATVPTLTLIQIKSAGMVTMDVNVPEGFPTALYNIKVYEVGGVEIATIATGKELKTGKVNLGTNSYSLPNVSSSATIYWEFTATSGDGVISTMDASKEWGVSVTSSGNTSKMTFTINIQKRAEATVTVNAPAEFAQSADNYVTVMVLGSDNKLLLKQKITISSGTQQATAQLYLPETSGCKLVYLVGEGYTASGPETYTADSAQHTVDGITVTVSKAGA